MNDGADSWRDLTQLVAGAQDAIIGETIDGVIASWNAGAERLFGYSAAEALGRPGTMLAAGAEVEEAARRLQRLRVGERIPLFACTRLHKDGTPRHVRVTVSPVLDSTGTLIGLSEILREQAADGAMAHALNQPLAAIILYLTAARRLLARDGDRAMLAEAVDRAMTQAARAAALIRDLRPPAAGVPDDPPG